MVDVLDGMLRVGVSRSVEFTSQWCRILRAGPVGPVTQADLHSVVRVVFDAFRGVVEELHRGVGEFIQRVVVHREDAAVRDWKGWMLEDLLVHTCMWLRPDGVPPLHESQRFQLIRPSIQRL